jgi:hypothetical protein
MRYPRDPDVILGAWLDENLIPLPTETRRAIDVDIRTIPQRRRPIWLPWRYLTMSTPLRLAATALAVVVVAFGAFVFLRPAPGGVGTTPPASDASPTPSPSTGADTTSWTPYTSTEYGFELRHPPEWSAFPETNRIWFSGGAEWATGATVGRYLDPDRDPDSWLQEHCGRTNAFTGNRPDDSDGAVACSRPLAEWTTTEVDGHEAKLARSPDECCTDVLVFVDDHVYVITGWDVVWEDETFLNAFLSTIRLMP